MLLIIDFGWFPKVNCIYFVPKNLEWSLMELSVENMIYNWVII